MDVLKLLKEQILDIYPGEWEVELADSSLRMEAPWSMLYNGPSFDETNAYLFDYFLFKGYEKFKTLEMSLEPGPPLYGEASFVEGRMQITPVYGIYQRVILEED